MLVNLFTKLRCWKVKEIEFLKVHGSIELAVTLKHKKKTWVRVLSLVEVVEHVGNLGLSNFHSINIIHQRFDFNKNSIGLIERGWCGPSKAFSQEMIKYLDFHTAACSIDPHHIERNKYVDHRRTYEQWTIQFKAEKLRFEYVRRIEQLDKLQAIL